MINFDVLFMPILFLFLWSTLFLPLILWKNTSFAKKYKLSLYAKSVKHIATLSFALMFFFLIAFSLDYLFSGSIVKYALTPFFLQTPFLVSLWFFAVCALLSFVLKKRSAKNQGVLLFINTLISFLLFFFVTFVSFVYLRTLPLFEGWQIQNIVAVEFLTQNSISLQLDFVDTSNSLLFFFVLYVFFALCLGVFGAHLLAMFFLIIRRNKDDFGRDYYRVLMLSHARRATVIGVCLSLVTLALYAITPLHHENLTRLFVTLLNFFPEAEVLKNYEYIKQFITYSTLCIPLSVLCVQRVAAQTNQGQSPMQKKSYIVLAFLLLTIGLISFIFILTV